MTPKSFWLLVGARSQKQEMQFVCLFHEDYAFLVTAAQLGFGPAMANAQSVYQQPNRPMKIPTPISLIAGSLWLSGSLFAQQVIRVTTAGEFLAAYPAAQEGDSILFAPGFYSVGSLGGFSIDKAIRLIRDPAFPAGSTVAIEVDGGPAILTAPSSGAALVLQGLNIFSNFGGRKETLEIRPGPGPIYFQDCAVGALHLFTAAVSASGVRLTANDSSFRGGGDFISPIQVTSTAGGPGLNLLNCEVALDGSVVEGGTGADPFFPFFFQGPGGPAVVSQGGSLVATGCIFLGGDSGVAPPVPGAGFPEDGGDCFRIQGAAASGIDLFQSTLTAGKTFAFGAPGQEFAGPGLPFAAITQSAADVGLDAPFWVSPGSSVSFNIATEDNNFPRFLLLHVAPGNLTIDTAAFSYALSPLPQVQVLPPSGPLLITAPQLPSNLPIAWILLQGVTIANQQPVLTSPRWLAIQ